MKPIIIIEDYLQNSGGGQDAIRTRETELRAEYDALKELEPDLPPFDEWVLTRQ